jgi:hypothetical protein
VRSADVGKFEAAEVAKVAITVESRSLHQRPNFLG